MADVIEIELIERANIDNLLFDIYPLFLSVSRQKHAGKALHIYHVDVDAITLSAGPNFAQISKPTNIVKNFGTPEQMYLRSSAAGDTSKQIDIIGQKADGSFGQFTFTSNAVNGTTAVDIGTWMFASMVIKRDAWAGNVIIDDDGASTTVYWTAPLGATATTGIMCVPKGFKGAFLAAKGNLLDVPSNANAANVFKLGQSIHFILNVSTGNYEAAQPIYTHITEESTEVLFQGMYEGAAVTLSSIHTYYVVWEV